MKKIKLTQGGIALVDDENYHLLSKHKWHLVKRGKTQYAETQIGGYKLLMHRLILPITPNMVVDHIDMDGLNNQENNLRLTTQSGNGCNRGMNASNTSGYKGVYLNQRKVKPWTSRIGFNGKYYFLGHFATKEKAALAYNKAAKKYHKEFAFINKIKQ